jgi:arginyl-tRNA synthetase
LEGEDDVRRAKINLTNAVGLVLKQGLGLLGIEAPEKM